MEASVLGVIVRTTQIRLEYHLRDLHLLVHMISALQLNLVVGVDI